ncbi:MAG: hypothetical protein WA211_15135 [Candidatus Acidiferrales bacterium]
MPGRIRLLGSFATAALALLVFSAMPLRAQDAGPQAPPPKFDVKRIPAEPHPGPPPVPEQVIIQKFVANEEVMKKAFETYNFTQSVRLDELTDPGGQFNVTGEVYTRPDGQRYLRVTKQPVSTLKLMHFSLEDVRVISSMPEFPLTADKIANYDLKYVGQEKLDQLNTYIFQVKPKLLSRKERYFQGVVWIDDQDFAIVKSYGKFVSELEGNGTELPFTMFETYRENFQGKYWLPTYTRSDDYLKSEQNDELPLRLVIHCTDFKLNTGANAGGPEEGPATQGSQAVAAGKTSPSPH